MIIFFRIGGGEEFVILLSNTTIAKGGESLCKKICRNVSESKEIFDIQRVTISVGATEVKKGDTEDSVFKRGDDLLYKAKKGGKNRVEIG